jgi:hemolysin activation/secretion protein
VKATLQAGKEPGTTDIIIKAENAVPVNLTLDYNNFGSKYVSRSRFGATFDIGNLFMEGAIFSIRGVSGDNPDDMFFGRASYSMPLNTLGTRLGAYYANGDYELGREFAILKMRGNIESYGIYASHPFIKKRIQSLTAEFGFDVKDAKQEILGTEVSKDKIRSLRGGITYESTDTAGRSFASLFITQGLGNNLGAMDNDSRFASRVGADNRFTKANIDVMRVQKIADPLFLILKGSAQWTSDSLVAIEQFSVGGADSVRGYPMGEFSGDDGYSVTAELRVSPLKNKELVQIALFMDNGWYSIKSPAVGQTKSDSLTGGGAGLRVNLPYDINMRFDAGFPIDPSRSSEGSEPIYYFQIVKKF